MIRVYGSPLCPDCVEFRKNLDTYQIPYEFTDITSAIVKLKEFLNLRDHNPAFEKVKENGSVGIPAIEREDGSVTVDWQSVIHEAGYTPLENTAGASCSLDHKGNC